MGSAGVANSGTIATLTNQGTIRGGNGGPGVNSGQGQPLPIGGSGGAGVSNSGAIATLTNGGTIAGGEGGTGRTGNAGGPGVWNSGAIATLTNNGAISGGAGRAPDGAGGAGILNSGAIGSLDNGGTIEGGLSATSGATGDAIYSAGAHASIGSITNTGRIIGNVVIDNQANVTVFGGTATTFGSWTGGAITMGTSPSPRATPRSATISPSTAAREP